MFPHNGVHCDRGEARLAGSYPAQSAPLGEAGRLMERIVVMYRESAGAAAHVLCQSQSLGLVSTTDGIHESKVGLVPLIDAEGSLFPDLLQFLSTSWRCNGQTVMRDEVWILSFHNHQSPQSSYDVLGTAHMITTKIDFIYAQFGGRQSDIGQGTFASVNIP